MADPDKKKPDLSDFFAKFADRNPYEYAKTAKESEKFITPSRVEKNDKIEKLWSEFKELQSRVEKRNKLTRDKKEVPADLDFSFNEIHKEMRRCIDSIIELDPDNYEALWNRASLHKDKGEYEESLKCLEKITNYLKPDDVDSWFERHDLLKIFERYPEALDCLDKILKIKPEIERDVLNAKGIVLGESGDEEGSLKCFELAFTKPGTYNDWKLWINKGTAFTGVGNPEKAIECYEKALELKPDNEFALFNIALTLHEMEEYTKALKFFNLAAAAVAKHSTGEISYWNFSIMLFRRKAETLFALRFKDTNGTQSALQCFDYGLEGIASIVTFGIETLPHPELVPLLFGKGMATQYLIVDEQDKLDVMSVALACYAEALKLEPSWGLAWYQSAIVLIEAAAHGKPDSAWETITLGFKKALEFPDSLNKKQIDICKIWAKLKETIKPEDLNQQFADLMRETMIQNRPDPSDPDFEKLNKDWKQNHPDSDNDPADK